MERYDPGLKTVALAQKARDAGDCKKAKSLRNYLNSQVTIKKGR
jgi:hypothetical protein